VIPGECFSGNQMILGGFKVKMRRVIHVWGDLWEVAAGPGPIVSQTNNNESGTGRNLPEIPPNMNNTPHLYLKST
jgi:hypothetical protein